MGRSIKDVAAGRNEQRFPTKFTGTLIVDRVPMGVEIADISRVGAQLRGDNLPLRGQEVVLCAIGLEVVATVAWNGEKSCGLTFHRPIAPLFVVYRNMPLRDLDLLNSADGDARRTPTRGQPATGSLTASSWSRSSGE
ncbi:MAG: PilZ domain-containing protein [Pseudomonadota bacterium]